MQNNLKKIFIADDDPDILDIIKMMLQTQGYTVVISNNANDIFNYKDKLPDLILLDIWMSGQDGRDICKRLKENQLTKDIPLIFISANSNIEEITKKHHADGFIPKPFEMKHLLNVVNDTLFTF
jgi:DNA-binding response OmpR family regulator